MIILSLSYSSLFEGWFAQCHDAMLVIYGTYHSTLSDLPLEYCIFSDQTGGTRLVRSRIIQQFLRTNEKPPSSIKVKIKTTDNRAFIPSQLHISNNLFSYVGASK